MDTQPRYELADLAMNGRLRDFLHAKRDAKPKVSYRKISRELDRHHNILVSDVTVRQWCIDLDVEGDA